MAKWVCPVCGYVYEGENPPEACPQCKAAGSKFLKQGGGLNFVAEHHVGDGIVVIKSPFHLRHPRVLYCLV